MKFFLVLIMLFSINNTINFAEEITEEEVVEVELPNFDVYINGSVINNENEMYPFILYKGITYIPMTWDVSNSLGLNLKWSKEEGLRISKSDSMTLLEQKGGGSYKKNKLYEALILTSDVKVNGKGIDNKTEQYPLLNFKNITYFPMTYDFMVKQFNSGYKWDGEVGLSVDADKALEVNYPLAEIFEEEVIIYELFEKESFVSKYFTISKSDDYYYISLTNQQNDAYDGKIVDVKLSYYDEKNKFLFDEFAYIGREYKSNKSYNTYSSRVGFTTIGMGRVEVEISFRSKSAIAAIAGNTGIEVEYLEENEITLEKIKNDGASYFYGVVEKSILDVMDKSVYNYTAINQTDGLIKEDKKLYSLYFVSNSRNNEISHGFGLLENDYVNMNKLNETSKIKFEGDNAYQSLRLYTDGGLLKSLGSSNIRLFDQDMNLIKVYVNITELDF